ncbi:hypothetical protein GH733_012047 [Mirounga leonina]|nr:hypothetical protein GH733_012047 [Mirounga leonina]
MNKRKHNLKKKKKKKAQFELSYKINNTLTECLQIIEGGVLSNEIFTILSGVPEAEKFAKFWIRKAKLLANRFTEGGTSASVVAEMNITSIEANKMEFEKFCLLKRENRIERAASRYLEMLQGHGLGVASLNELLEVEEQSVSIFHKNEALPVTLEFKIFES